ncbi:MAG: polysaccharide deacetylase family protein [Coriobacteriia bacterium]|nr:polysaccharide deacetylase family protein [Coriobacteriia bacterium]
MVDYLVALAACGGLTVVLLLVWQRARGSESGKWRLAARVGLALAVAMIVTGVGLYQLTKSRSLQLVGELVHRVETGERVVALTFDDGPTPEYTDQVLQELEAHDAAATFYLVGTAAEDHPDLVAAIVKAGHELGNHSYSHPRMYFISTAMVKREIEQTDEIFRAAGYSGPITFRPPGCKRLLTTPLYLASTDRTTVTWDLEPDSLSEIADDADALADYVVDNIRPGSIVLMHVMYDGREPSRAALPEILKRLEAEGYRFVTVSELLALDDR